MRHDKRQLCAAPWRHPARHGRPDEAAGPLLLFHCASGRLRPAPRSPPGCPGWGRLLEPVTDGSGIRGELFFVCNKILSADRTPPNRTSSKRVNHTARIRAIRKALTGIGQPGTRSLVGTKGRGFSKWRLEMTWRARDGLVGATTCSPSSTPATAGWWNCATGPEQIRKQGPPRSRVPAGRRPVGIVPELSAPAGGDPEKTAAAISQEQVGPGTGRPLPGGGPGSVGAPLVGVHFSS